MTYGAIALHQKPSKQHTNLQDPNRVNGQNSNPELVPER